MHKLTSLRLGQVVAQCYGALHGDGMLVACLAAHVLARTGLDTYPKSMSFPFTKDTPAAIDSAKAKARAWLKTMGVTA